jgi:hypothetical protein
MTLYRLRDGFAAIVIDVLNHERGDSNVMLPAVICPRHTG